MKTIMKLKYMFLYALVMIGMLACQEDALIDTYEIKAPIITDFSPKTGEVGSDITITGENLQRVDSVLIGGGLAEIKYRVNSNSIVVTVVGSSRNGKIQISNVSGKSASTDDFTITYLTPVIAAANYPVEGLVNEDIVIVGEHLNVIDSIIIGNMKANIVSKRPNEIVFKVPFLDTEDPISFRFAYFDGSQNLLVGPAGNTFTILKEAPSISYAPTSLTKYSPVTIQGELLNLIDSIYVGNVKMLIKSKSDTEIKIDMPTNYFSGNMTGSLRGYYYGVRTVLMANNFQVTADPNEPRFYKYLNVLLSARVGYGGTEDAFFDAESGTAINSCSAAGAMSDIDFYLYDQSGYVQLYGPHNGSSTVKNFKCDGKTIDAQDGSWNNFYGSTTGITTKFRVLSSDSANHVAVINAYNAGTFVELTDDVFAGITPPATSSPRIYKSYLDNGYSIASGHVSIDKNSIIWVKNYTTKKNGIIKVTGMPKEAVNGRIPELTFDIIWQK